MKKLDHGFVLNLDLPLGDQFFFSESAITKDELTEEIAEILNQRKDWRSIPFVRDPMKIIIDERKVIQIYLENEIREEVRETEAYKNMKFFTPLNIVRTQIIILNNRSVPGTEICIEIIKNLQKKFPRSVYVKDATVPVGGNEIQNIEIDTDFIYSDGMKELLEADDDD